MFDIKEKDLRTSINDFRFRKLLIAPKELNVGKNKETTKYTAPSERNVLWAHIAFV